MNPDGFDDVRLLLRDADPGPLPDLDVDAILRDGVRARRRATAERWLAAAAVVVVLGGAAAGIAYLERPAQVYTAGPSASSTTGTVPEPLSADQWLLYGQLGIDAASSVRYVGELGTTPDGTVVTVDTVLGRGTAQGTVTAGGATSRYLTVGGRTYMEPAALLELGLVPASAVDGAAWVVLGGERFRVPTGVPGPAGTADASRMNPVLVEQRVVDGTATQGISTVWDDGSGTLGKRVFYLEADRPYRPLLVTIDGREVSRFSEWNAPVSTPVAPPAADVVDVPGL